MTDIECIELMKNIYLGEPLTIRGGNALSILGIKIEEQEFFKNVFVEPFTLFYSSSDEKIDENVEPDLDYSKEIDLNDLINSKGTFEERLKNLSDTLYVIKGGSGTGKTTYAHYLKYKYGDTINFSFFDFEKTAQSIYILEDTFDFKDKYFSNLWKFISRLTVQISIILEAKSGQSEDQHKLFINKIVNRYYGHFMMRNKDNIIDNDDVKLFFNILKEYGSSEWKYCNLSQQIKKFFTKKFDEFENDDGERAVEYVTSILIRLYYCLFDIEGQKNLCIIDNIERFVEFDEKHPIQLCELQTILNGVMNAISSMRIHENALNSRENFYGFMLITRDTSISLAEYHHYDDYNRDSEINITNWFCADHIFISKEDAFGKAFPDLKNHPKYKAYKNIMSDLSPYNWGMHDVISKIYNCNNRRIVRNVIGALANVPIEAIEQFNLLWEEAQDVTDQQKICHLKHLCRKFIFRILLDHAQTKQYFDRLLVEVRPVNGANGSRVSSENSSYARKISTILHREALDNNGYCTFPNIIEAILKKPYVNNNITPEKISDLASILYLMNETRNEYTYWAPLIMIKFDSEEIYNEQRLVSKLEEQWNFYKNNRRDHLNDFEKYGIKITMSGSLFAKVCCDFEYFACRFAKNYPALFIRQNLRKSKGESYDCLDLINIVKYNAFECIDEIIRKDNDFFSSLGNATSVNKFSALYTENSKYKWNYKANRISRQVTAHPIRIINSHMGYISHYAIFVKDLSEEKFEDKNDKEKIIAGLKKIIEDYKNKKNDIIYSNPEYFNQTV